MEDIRWIQRFENFNRAFILLREILEDSAEISELAPIVKEGIIHRFEYTFELAWKTLKDKMENDGITIDKTSPKHVFKMAYQSKYLNNIETWLQMANDRNLMSHTYDFETLDKVLVALKDNYYPQLAELYSYLLAARQQV